MKTKQIHQQANTAKLIHRWIPTYNQLAKQNCQQTAICPRCQTQPETAQHILQCDHEQSIQSRSNRLYATIKAMNDLHSDQAILSTFENKLAAALHITSQNKYNAPNTIQPQVTKALHHQNIIGWENILRGYVSNFWTTAQLTTRPKNKNKTAHNQWGIKLTQLMIDLHRSIWEDRNLFVHGKDRKESNEKARIMLQERIRKIYRHAPKLASRYPPLTAPPLRTD